MRLTARILLIAASAVVSATSVRAQEPEDKPPKGPEHTALAQRTGHWDYTGTVYPEDPKAEPVKMAGTYETEFLGDSSWLITKGRGRVGGTPYDFVGLMCYDAKKARYTATWALSIFPPSLTIAEGTYDEPNRTLSWKEQEETDPESGQKVITKGEDVFEDEDTLVTASFIKRPGSKEFVKLFETTDKRRKTP